MTEDLHQLDVQVLLADHADVAGGKLYLNGGCWTITRPGAPHAVAVIIEVPWDMTNRRMEVVVELLDSDGHPVAPRGNPVRLVRPMEAGRPPGHPIGAPVTGLVTTLNVNGLPLENGARYEWRISVDGTSLAHWSRAFSVVAAPTPPKQA
ncbi:MAG: hypothetical protein GY745_09865 [Actinomycetia bacterium]|nr:hypothetical protein [Actinomycetes bacterium]